MYDMTEHIERIYEQGILLPTYENASLELQEENIKIVIRKILSASHLPEQLAKAEERIKELEEKVEKLEYDVERKRKKIKEISENAYSASTDDINRIIALEDIIQEKTITDEVELAVNLMQGWRRKGKSDEEMARGIIKYALEWRRMKIRFDREEELKALNSQRCTT